MWDVSRLEPRQLIPARAFPQCVAPSCPSGRCSTLTHRHPQTARASHGPRQQQGLQAGAAVQPHHWRVACITPPSHRPVAWNTDARGAADGGLVIPDSDVYVYDVDTDRVTSHSFGPLRYVRGAPRPLLTRAHACPGTQRPARRSLTLACCGAQPSTVVWDQAEEKLLAVETRKVRAALVLRRAPLTASCAQYVFTNKEERKDFALMKSLSQRVRGRLTRLAARR
jgi:hypothetical protein